MRHSFSCEFSENQCSTNLTKLQILDNLAVNDLYSMPNHDLCWSQWNCHEIDFSQSVDLSCKIFNFWCKLQVYQADHGIRWQAGDLKFVILVLAEGWRIICPFWLIIYKRVFRDYQKASIRKKSCPSCWPDCKNFAATIEYSSRAIGELYMPCIIRFFLLECLFCGIRCGYAKHRPKKHPSSSLSSQRTAEQAYNICHSSSDYISPP